MRVYTSLKVRLDDSRKTIRNEILTQLVNKVDPRDFNQTILTQLGNMLRQNQEKTHLTLGEFTGIASSIHEGMKESAVRELSKEFNEKFEEIKQSMRKAFNEIAREEEEKDREDIMQRRGGRGRPPPDDSIHR